MDRIQDRLQLFSRPRSHEVDHVGKTEEEKEEAAIAKSERAAQQAAERGLDDERARQLKEAERARLEAERAPQRQLISDEQSQRMQTQTRLNFAPATTSPQTPFPDGSSAIPSASDGHSLDQPHVALDSDVGRIGIARRFRLF
ncbi:hypothetical protein MVLG_07153 [Microbotryum lychnidis-dioicae p1A1 Lamole]|uniref:Uncharacterized protein n=1 Tax=Microbotryum lychnidis-dioicae (strain p1A1 Lamole / MvSl-1064) TaxID=683840 RepID=U5HJH1_USTV1|nr:hypothetical protein MVLG_07153 [Microbotryum lychnidis-dioicae p1A1 Lamole]|eukprot:KDE02284.1 hypothetical protein MVLG_07153 [Microbotryum lychnidis-dioicae p1A1 Lamole]